MINKKGFGQVQSNQPNDQETARATQLVKTSTANHLRNLKLVAGVKVC